jgi:integrase
MREKLTDRLAKTMDPTPGKIERYFDTDTERSPRGFLLRITPAGARAWALQYRVKDSGRQREITIGEVRSWPLAEARKRGHELRRLIDDGHDPVAEREEKRSEPTVAELWDRFEAEALPSRAPRTQAEYRAQMRDWILPAISRLKVAAVSREDIQKLHRKITSADKARRANSVKSLCSTLFQQAITWRMCEDNPCQHVKGNREHGRERYLTPEEISRLMGEIERCRDKGGRWVDSCDLIELAVYTGARRGELLGMSWDQLDLGAGVWTKPAVTTKQRRVHRGPLSQDAVALLRRRAAEREGGKVVRLRANDFVFHRGNAKSAANMLESDWYQIRARAGLNDVRFHDLRHSFASLLVNAGLSLPIIGQMLGHSKPQTTARYAHLADSPLRDAAEKVAAIVRGPTK